MSNRYLIAHKVRGEAAFDVAEQQPCVFCQSYTSVTGAWCEAERPQAECAECDGLGYWWIIPTSDHRAYPYWSHELSYLGTGCDYYVLGNEYRKGLVPPMPLGLPDHYLRGPAPKVDIRALFKKSQPAPAPETFIKRRL